MTTLSRESAPDPKNEIARGSERRVYMVENAPDRLIKIMRSKYLRAVSSANDSTLVGWFRIRQAYALYLRENRAWTDAMLRAAVRGEAPPLARVGDLILTPQGLGQTVEHVRSAKGNTGQSLDDLLASGPLSDERLAALNSFVVALYDWHIPAYDLGPKNIVWDEIENRFMLVDGFGDRSFIPIKTWFRRANNRRLDRAFRDSARASGLVWDNRLRQFGHPA